MDDDFGLWDVILSMFWFMLLIAWIWLLISILGDIFRDRTLGGGAKALWVVFLIFLPWLGALIYLIARGGSMHERAEEAASAMTRPCVPTCATRPDRPRGAWPTSWPS